MRARALATPGLLIGRLLALGALALLGAGCSRAVSEHQRAADAASRAYVAGEYAQARELWAQAEAAAENDQERAESRYRAALTRARAGDWAGAAQELHELSRALPATPRAARALLEEGRLRERLGDEPGALACYDTVLGEHLSAPSAGAAARAALRLAAPGPAARLRWLDAFLARRPPEALDEWALNEQAQALEATGATEQAIARYLLAATRYPYPYGAHWDDALMHAARLQRASGEPRRALTTLRRLLKEREGARLTGSYERANFAKAAYLSAEILRDDLGDVEGARAAFRDVFDDFTTSLQRDDALWQEALLPGTPAQRCAPLERLVGELPESRYSACAALLCPALESAAPPSKRPCPHYIRREAEPLSLHKTR